MAEEEVIRKRLAVEGEGGGDDRRVMSLLKTFARWCNGQTVDEESEATYQKMLFTLGEFQLMHSTQACSKTCSNYPHKLTCRAMCQCVCVEFGE